MKNNFFILLEYSKEYLNIEDNINKILKMLDYEAEDGVQS
jgi:hypothetical protein